MLVRADRAVLLAGGHWSSRVGDGDVDAAVAAPGDEYSAAARAGGNGVGHDGVAAVGVEPGPQLSAGCGAVGDGGGGGARDIADPGDVHLVPGGADGHAMGEVVGVGR